MVTVQREACRTSPKLLAKTRTEILIIPIILSILSTFGRDTGHAEPHRKNPVDKNKGDRLLGRFNRMLGMIWMTEIVLFMVAQNQAVKDRLGAEVEEEAHLESSGLEVVV